jgi:predicted AlkP superfamily phosphohydrolase/phosphomutase
MSIATGLSPAKHGVYDFWDYSQQTKGMLKNLVTHRKAGKAIWNILSELNRQVIVANVPVTYPPEPVNGIMVSGHMTPSENCNFTYPSSFKDELLQAVPDYQIELSPKVASGQVGDIFSDTLHITYKRLAMLRLLLAKPWDFLFIVFTEADRIQHRRWDDICAMHPQAVAYYQLLDQALGLMLTTLQPEDLLLIVSDHGFQGARRAFQIQEYLYRQGLLRLNSKQKYLQDILVDRSRNIAWSLGLQGIPTRVRRSLREKGILRGLHEHHVIPSSNIDTEHTLAWLAVHSGAIAGYADIFLDERLEQKDIELLEAALQELRDPQTGLPLVAQIERDDAFGSGPFTPTRRHLIVLSREQVTLRTDLGVKNLWRALDSSSGIHHPDGIIYIYGAGVRPGVTIEPAHVYDITPTILARIGLPLSADFDGKVIADAFDETMVPNEPANSPETVGQRMRKLAS